MKARQRRKIQAFFLYPTTNTDDEWNQLYVAQAKNSFKERYPSHKITNVSWLHTDTHREFEQKMPALRVVVEGVKV